MKLIFKTRFFWILILAIVVSFLIINLTYAGDCLLISQNTYDKAVRQGYEVRLVTGVDDNGTGHRWVEYLDKGKWLVWDDAVWYVRGRSAYTADELGYQTKYISKVSFRGNQNR